jgi:hypothetical protein
VSQPLVLVQQQSLVKRLRPSSVLESLPMGLLSGALLPMELPLWEQAPRLLDPCRLRLR